MKLEVIVLKKYAFIEYLLVLPKCHATKMYVTKMSYYQNVCYQNVLLPKCPVTEMSCYQNVQLPKCPVTEMSVTKTSITKVSFTEMSGYRISHLVNSGQATLRKLAYSEAGQTLASMNEWEASESYL